MFKAFLALTLALLATCSFHQVVAIDTDMKNLDAALTSEVPGSACGPFFEFADQTPIFRKFENADECTLFSNKEPAVLPPVSANTESFCRNCFTLPPSQKDDCTKCVTVSAFGDFLGFVANPDNLSSRCATPGMDTDCLCRLALVEVFAGSHHVDNFRSLCQRTHCPKQAKCVAKLFFETATGSNPNSINDAETCFTKTCH